MLKTPKHYTEIDNSIMPVKLGIKLCHNYCVLFEPTIEEVKTIHNIVKETIFFIFTEKEHEYWEGLPKSHYIVNPFRVSGLTTEQIYTIAQDLVINFVHRA